MDTTKNAETKQQKKMMKAKLPAIYEAITSPHFTIVVDEEDYCLVTLNGKKPNTSIITKLNEEIKGFTKRATPTNNIIKKEHELIYAFLLNHRRRTKNNEAHIPAKFRLYNNKGKRVYLINQSEHVKEEIEGFFNTFFSQVELILAKIKSIAKWIEEVQQKIAEEVPEEVMKKIKKEVTEEIKDAIKEEVSEDVKFKKGECHRDIVAYGLGLFFTKAIILQKVSPREQSIPTKFIKKLLKRLGLKAIPSVSSIITQLQERPIDECALWLGELYILFHHHFPKGKDFAEKKKRDIAKKADIELQSVVLFVYEVIDDFIRIVNSYKAIYPQTLFPWMKNKYRFDHYLHENSSHSIIKSVLAQRELEIS
ncbi:hypothetical protein EYV94_10600 [Puteibacter caeruleilacunae]|nr:hypothetical protein EYV94_10600 [Puteibacter caeruleilacunae]